MYDLLSLQDCQVMSFVIVIATLHILLFGFPADSIIGEELDDAP